ncbi:MAG: ribonuclease E/G [Alphaproteobacteria bacterium]|nr:ribonuclease E/G [Alphaproteobacteria bacterium]
MRAEKIVYDRNEDTFGIAVFDADGLMEIDIYNEHRALEGNIYLGRIVKKINLANDKTGFMVNIGDGHEAFLNSYEPSLKEANMSEGQSVVVQVSQEKRAEKGAKLVRNIQLVGTYLVYCPFKFSVDFSRKIEDVEKAEKYAGFVQDHSTNQEGWVLRTMAVEATENQLLEEMTVLREAYENIRHKARIEQAPALLYAKENPLFEYIRRYRDSLKEVVIDTPKLQEEVNAVFDGKITLCREGFEEYGVDDAIVEALNRTVKLKHGGSLQIEETHACVAIDVDSGNVHNVGDIDALNVEAAKEIVRQVRLRNLSGKIIVDFAGSSEYRFMKNIIDCLEEEFADDACHSRVLGLSRAGNIEILRQRRRPSLRDLYTVECPACAGTGRVEP